MSSTLEYTGRDLVEDVQEWADVVDLVVDLVYRAEPFVHPSRIYLYGRENRCVGCRMTCRKVTICKAVWNALACAGLNPGAIAKAMENEWGNDRAWDRWTGHKIQFYDTDEFKGRKIKRSR